MAVTIKASKEGLEKVEEARKKKGWKADALSWYDAAKTSPATLKRFRSGNRIQKETFINICEAVELNWEEIVDDTSPTEVSDSRFYLTLNATIEAVDRAKAEAIVTFVNNTLGGELAQLFRIERGSVVLVLEGSLETFERIEYLFATGQLRSILGFEIEGVRLESAEIVNLRDWLENLYQRDWQPVERVLAPAAHRGDRSTATPEAIADLIPLLRQENSEATRRQAAEKLGDVGAGSRETISALTELLETTKDEETLWQAAIALGKIDRDNPAAVRLAKIVNLGEPDNLPVAIIVAFRLDSDEEASVRLWVEPASDRAFLPPHLKLAVLDKSGDAFIEVESSDTDSYIQREFSGPVGERFTVRLSLGDASIAEELDLLANR